MRKQFIQILAGLLLLVPLANAETLPSPENLAFDNGVLSWDAVDGATGYNIYFDYRYFDTVKGSTQYEPGQSGSYWVVAFDDDGNFGVTYGDYVDVQVDQGSDNISVTYNYYNAIVQKTCTDVGPGESCIASCTSTETHLDPPEFTMFLSGGGCSTSDIVEADVFISPNTYSCTVPTFSGEVIAQAVCVLW